MGGLASVLNLLSKASKGARSQRALSRKALEEALRAGKTAQQIADETGIALEAVERAQQSLLPSLKASAETDAFNRTKRIVSQRRRIKDEADRSLLSQVQEASQSGFSVKEIAGTFSTSETTVRNLLKFGKKTRSSGPKGEARLRDALPTAVARPFRELSKAEKAAEIKRLADQRGMNATEIGREMGAADVSVKRIADANEIFLPKGRKGRAKLRGSPTTGTRIKTPATGTSSLPGQAEESLIRTSRQAGRSGVFSGGSLSSLSKRVERPSRISADAPRFKELPEGPSLAESSASSLTAPTVDVEKEVVRQRTLLSALEDLNPSEQREVEGFLVSGDAISPQLIGKLRRAFSKRGITSAFGLSALATALGSQGEAEAGGVGSLLRFTSGAVKGARKTAGAGASPAEVVNELIRTGRAGVLGRNTAKRFGLPDEMAQDFESEAGMIAFKAIGGFDPKKGASFDTFLSNVLGSGLLDRARSTSFGKKSTSAAPTSGVGKTRSKTKIRAEDQISLETPVELAGTREKSTLGSTIVDTSLTPETALILQNRRDSVLGLLKSLTVQEEEVARRILSGDTAVEITQDLGISGGRVSQLRTSVIKKAQKGLGLSVAAATALMTGEALKGGEFVPAEEVRQQLQGIIKPREEEASKFPTTALGSIERSVQTGMDDILEALSNIGSRFGIAPVLDFPQLLSGALSVAQPILGPGENLRRSLANLIQSDPTRTAVGPLGLDPGAQPSPPLPLEFQEGAEQARGQARKRFTEGLRNLGISDIGNPLRPSTGDPALDLLSDAAAVLPAAATVKAVKGILPKPLRKTLAKAGKAAKEVGALGPTTPDFNALEKVRRTLETTPRKRFLSRVGDAFDKSRDAVNRLPERLQEVVTSGFAPLKFLQRKVLDANGVPRPQLDLARRFEQTAGAPGMAEQDRFKFFQAVMRPVRKNLSELSEYIVSRRVIDRLDVDSRIRRRTQELLDARSIPDLSPQEAVALQRLVADPGLHKSLLQAQRAKANRKPILTEALGQDARLVDLDSALDKANAVLGSEGLPKLGSRFVGDYTAEEGHEAIRLLRTSLGEQKFSEIELAASQFQEFAERTLQLQVSKGRMSTETAEQIRELNDFYAPFQVLKETEAIETSVDILRAAPLPGRSLSNIDPLTEAIEGINRIDFKLEDPLLAMQRQIYRSRLLAEKNEKMLLLAELADVDQTGLIRKVAPNAKPSEGMRVVRYLDNGQPMGLEVSQEVARAVQGITSSQTELLSLMALNGSNRTLTERALRGSRSAFRASATSFNLGFQVPNLFLADLPTTALLSRFGVGGKGLSDFVRFPSDFVYSFFTAMGGNFSRPNQLFQEARKAGVFGSTIQRQLTPGAFTSNKLIGAPRNVPQWIRDQVVNSIPRLSNALEETNKILGFKRGLEIKGLAKNKITFDAKGFQKIANMDPEKADALLREIVTEVRNYGGSPDFSKRGLISDPARGLGDLNLLFVFFNARLQGAARDLSRLAGTAEGGKKAAAKAWLRLSTAVGTPTMALALANRQDRDYEWNGQTFNVAEDFSRREQWEKTNYFMFNLGPLISQFPQLEKVFGPARIINELGENVPNYYRIQKRETMRMFSNMIEAGVDFAMKRDSQALEGFAIDFMEGISPVNIEGRNLREKAESVASGLNPLIRTPLEQISGERGRNFFRHRDIEPEFIQGQESAKLSPERRFLSSTPELFKNVSAAARSIAPEQLGEFMSPLRTQAAIEGLTAGFVTQFLRKPSVGREESLIGRAAETPLAGALVRRFLGSTREAQSKEFKQLLFDVERSFADEAFDERGLAQQAGRGENREGALKFLRSLDPVLDGAKVNMFADVFFKEFTRAKLRDPEFQKRMAQDPELREAMSEVQAILSPQRDMRQVSQLGVASGERAQFIVQRLEQLPDAESRLEFLDGLRKSKVLSEKTMLQVGQAILEKEAAPDPTQPSRPSQPSSGTPSFNSAFFSKSESDFIEFDDRRQKELRKLGLFGSGSPAVLPDIQTLIENEARTQGFSEALALAVVARETLGGRDLTTFNPSVNSARGPFQLTRATARALQVNRLDMQENVRGGVALLQELTSSFQGDQELALAAFFIGERRTRQLMQQGGKQAVLDFNPSDTVGKKQGRVGQFTRQVLEISRMFEANPRASLGDLRRALR